MLGLIAAALGVPQDVVDAIPALQEAIPEAMPYIEAIAAALVPVGAWAWGRLRPDNATLVMRPFKPGSAPLIPTKR